MRVCLHHGFTREGTRLWALRNSDAIHWEAYSQLFVDSGSRSDPATFCRTLLCESECRVAAATTRQLFLSLACVLLGIGMLMVYSASVTARPTEFEQVYLSRQVMFLGVALAGGVAASLLPAVFWRRAAPWLFVATLGMLAAVLIPGVGTRVNGAQRWFRLAGWSMQPSEIAKITLPLFVCWWATREAASAVDATGWRILRSLRRFGARSLVLVPIGVLLVLIALEPDLGTSAFLAGVALLALFVAGWPLVNFAAALLLAVPAAAGVALLRPYQMQRITGFIAAWRDFNDAPYQVKQSLITLGVGGTTGVGLGQGWQKLSFLPEANTDFVVAVLGEELGLIGTLGLISIWIGLYLTGLRMLSPLPSRSFEYAAGVTLLTQLVLQAALNTAVVTAMVPPKGIAHPLISYGGSSLVASILTLGIITSLARQPLTPHP